ncbi:helix-turn-helix domain-containing protein [Nocardia jiangxiensis]|uniref:helix-turn-helix domain-containing protein n=1 Tax=Nocardia jiangxiensis TaxID=282685 RepID=UPI0005929CFE|nr:helix-turn-helix transcriptional regulator [Nocardia jiangxiensis]
MAGPTSASRTLGRELAELRKRAKMTISAAAKVAEYSPPTMRRLEDGVKTKVTNLVINALADAYECSDQERRMLLALTAESLEASKSGGSWWRAYADAISGDFSHYISLEDAADSVTMWATSLVPGLLQTRDYRREIAWAENPTWTHEEVEQRVSLAEQRQKRLEEPEFQLDVIIGEAVLRNQLGGGAVMEKQLVRLAEISELPGNCIRVVPFGTPNPVGLLSGPFVLLTFPTLAESRLGVPPVVYVEEYTGDLFLEREVELAQYRNAVERISRVALAPSETRDLVAKVAKEYAR